VQANVSGSAATQGKKLSRKEACLIQQLGPAVTQPCAVFYLALLRLVVRIFHHAVISHLHSITNGRLKSRLDSFEKHTAATRECPNDVASPAVLLLAPRSS
jgi:hypothetical protein